MRKIITVVKDRVFNKTQYDTVSGKLSWAVLVRPDPTFNCWSINLHPTPDSLEKIREWQSRGMKNTIKKDEDGWFVKFRCPVNKKRKDGTIWAFEAPEVKDVSGQPIDGSRVGNGSDGVLRLEIYEHPTPGGGKAIASRLVGVKVIDLVPYEPAVETDEQGEVVEAW
jgi:hypothetical protein